MSRFTLSGLGLLIGCIGCAAPLGESTPQNVRGPGTRAHPPATAVPPPAEGDACDGAAERPESPDPVVGAVPVWAQAFGERTGPVRLFVQRDRVVVSTQGGRSVALHLRTGALCAVLVEAPSAQSVSVIDAYSARTTMLDGALVGPRGTHLAAIDVRTGKPLWTSAIAGLDASTDEYALRDGVELAAASGVVAASFQVQRAAADGSGYHAEQLLLGLDGASGSELWRQSFRDLRAMVPYRSERVLLASDGQVLLALFPGELVGLEPRSGTVLYRVRWAAPDPRLFVGGGRALLAFPDGQLRFYDAASGRDLVTSRSPGRTLAHAALRAERTYAAVEDPNGAALVALDATGGVLWRYSAAYSVVNLDLDAAEDTLHVLEGDGRFWALDPATGVRRWGLSVGSARAVAAARTESGRPRVLVARDALAAFDVDPARPPAPLKPFLRWSIAPADPSTDDTSMCSAREVALVDGDERVVWRRPLPARIRREKRDACRYYRQHPRDQPFMPFLELERAFVLQAQSGVLVLRRSDGAVLLDAATPSPGNGRIFDRGTFDLYPGPSCSGPAPHVFSRCEDHLLFFNGTTAHYIDLNTFRIEARGTFDGTTEPVPGRPAESRATIKLGRYTLVLRGVTYMR